ncbi:MAG: M56 family metallopeptidase, partial [Thermoguttaceae bacterium]
MTTFLCQIILSAVILAVSVGVVILITRVFRLRSAVVIRTLWGAVLVLPLFAATIPLQIVYRPRELALNEQTQGLSGNLSETKPGLRRNIENDFSDISKYTNRLGIPFEQINVSLVENQLDSVGTKSDSSETMSQQHVVEPEIDTQDKQTSDFNTNTKLDTVNLVHEPAPYNADFDYEKILTCFVICMTSLWTSGIIFLLTKRIVYWSKLRKILRDTEPADVETTELWESLLKRHSVKLNIPVMFSETLGPAIVKRNVFTTQRFLLVLPRNFWEEITPEMQVGVLRHELGHLIHRDTVLTPIVDVLTFLQWFNPAAWYANKQFALA